MKKSVSELVPRQFHISFQIGCKDSIQKFFTACRIYRFFLFPSRLSNSYCSIYQQYKVSQTVVCGQHVVNSLAKRRPKKVLWETVRGKPYHSLFGYSLIYYVFTFIIFVNSKHVLQGLFSWLLCLNCIRWCLASSESLKPHFCLLGLDNPFWKMSERACVYIISK